MANKLHDIQFLRWVTVVASFALIPSFMMGFAGVWSILYAIIMAYFIRRRSVDLLIELEAMDDYLQRAAKAVKSVALIGFESIVYLIIPVAILAYAIDWGWVQQVQSGMDVSFYNMFNSWLMDSKPYESFHPQIQLRYVFPVFALFEMMLVIFLAGRKLNKVMVEAAWISWLLKFYEFMPQSMYFVFYMVGRLCVIISLFGTAYICAVVSDFVDKFPLLPMYSVAVAVVALCGSCVVPAALCSNFSPFLLKNSNNL